MSKYFVKTHLKIKLTPVIVHLFMTYILFTTLISDRLIFRHLNVMYWHKHAAEVQLTKLCYIYNITISFAWNCIISDINECSTGSHNCQQRCTNTLGSYRCSCNSGYSLNSDRRTCRGRNICHVNDIF